MKVAMVDDELQMTNLIDEYMEKFCQENEETITRETFCDAREFVEGYDCSYDLILFDVEMPQMNGIDAARKIRKKDKNVIIMFITNMAQYAIRGYEVEAIDYVIKPIGYQDFALKMKKAMRYISRNDNQQIMIATPEGKIPLAVSDITYIEVIRHYLHYHTTTNVYEVRGVMKEVEEKFEKLHFMRCNQSYLVNLAHVRAINGNDVVVNEDELPISRNRKTDFVNAFTRYVGGMNQ